MKYGWTCSRVVILCLSFILKLLFWVHKNYNVTTEPIYHGLKTNQILGFKIMTVMTDWMTKLTQSLSVMTAYYNCQITNNAGTASVIVKLSWWLGLTIICISQQETWPMSAAAFVNIHCFWLSASRTLPESLQTSANIILAAFLEISAALPTLCIINKYTYIYIGQYCLQTYNIRWFLKTFLSAPINLFNYFQHFSFLIH